MQVIIDRFEENYAVCEKKDRTMMNIERMKIPKNAKEGDVLSINKDDIFIDAEETERRRKEIEELAKKLFNK